MYVVTISFSSTFMLKNFFKTAARTIVKYKTYSIINFVGLTCGLTVALLIITYVRNELNYDRFQAKAERLYRLRYDINGFQIASSPPPIAPLLREFFPEVEEAGRMFMRNVSITKPGSTEAFEEGGIVFADSSITKMMTFEFIKGNPQQALVDKYTIILNEEMAKKYFGDNNPIGETLLLSGDHSFKVTGVVKNFPETSHIRFNMLVPYDDMFELEDEKTEQVLRANLERNFVISHSYTYVLLKSGATPDNMNEKMGDFLKKYADPSRLIGQVFTLMPVLDIHMKSTLGAEPTSTNSMTTIYIFAGVGLLTLLIACINYINLSTAQSITRIKEIGIRKVMGSMKSQLIVQFLTESLLFTMASMAIAYVCFYLTLPLLNLLTNKHLLFAQVIDTPLILLSIILLLGMTLMAGGYPAYFVSRFESISAIKGQGAGMQNRQLLRKALVVFQLTIACLLLSGSLIIFKQLTFLQDLPLGFQKDHIITVPLYSQNFNGFFRQGDTTFQSRLQSFRNIVEKESGVQSTTLSSGSPGSGSVYRGIIPDGFTREDNLLAANMSVDYDFLKVYDIPLAYGRTFSQEFPSDLTTSFIINETAIKEFNWESEETVLGKEIVREGKKGTVIGVIRDFNFDGISRPLSALILEYFPPQFSTLSLFVLTMPMCKAH